MRLSFKMKMRVQSPKSKVQSFFKNRRPKIKARLQSGYSLLELIITLTVLAILVMGTIPLAQNAVKRQKELRLRETLRQIRGAIDDFKRDTVGACREGAISTGNPIGRGLIPAAPADPRSRVIVDDCTIFDTENLDRYPPSLEVLVEGVKVRPRGVSPQSNSGGVFNGRNATEINEEKDVIKFYLREMPIDPMTGESDWQLRSSYQSEDSSWDSVNIFDVRSNSEEEALNGEKYSDW